jgi:hypothetical protein
MSREDLEHGGGNETGEPVAVDHEDDDWWLGVVCGVEPTMLVRFAWSSRPGVASPAPKLSKVESWPPRETAHSSSLRHRRVYKCRQQSKVLAPVAQENGPLETRAAYKDVVGRSGVNWRGENERRRESSHKSRFPSHTTITPATTRGLPVPRRGPQRIAVKGHSRTLVQPTADEDAALSLGPCRLLVRLRLEHDQIAESATIDLVGVTARCAQKGRGWIEEPVWADES